MNVEISAVVMGAVMVVLVAIAAIGLWRVQRDPKKPDLLDLLTSTDKTGKVRFDSRKCFEAGAFATSTWAFVHLTLTHQLTEWFLAAYIGAWVFARTMRDREKRLNNVPPSENQ
jgi:cytochrome oxidase assembly protein ShyY1